MYREEMQAGPVGVADRGPSPHPGLQSLPRHHVIHHGQLTMDLDLHEMEGEDPRIVLDSGISQGFWATAREAFQSQLPHGDKLWRITVFGGIYTVAISRIGSYLRENHPPVQDVCLTTALPNYLLDALTNSSSASSFTAAFDAYLDETAQATRARLAKRFPWLPLPNSDEATGYFLEPRPLTWLSRFKITGLPPGLKAAYLVRVKDAAGLCGEAYTDEHETITRLWQRAIELTVEVGAGIPTSFYMLGAQNAVVVEPSSCGTTLLVTVWYRAASIPDILKASEKATNAVSPILRQFKAYHAF